MRRDDDLRVRPGRIRSSRIPRARSFLAQALTAAQKAGGLRSGAHSGCASFGRGRSAALAAASLLSARARGAVVKARVVRQGRSPGALRAHLAYLQRDGVTRDAQPGRLFDADGDEAPGGGFAERCKDDRHHFRFIISPDDAAELDLKGFTRELMQQAAQDLGTSLDWVAVEHWNTEHPHIHLLVRGRTERSEDLVISRDYISRGLRARAGALVTRDLGPKSEREVRRGLEAEVGAERFTRLDRVLVRDAAASDGLIDLRRCGADRRDDLRELRIGRLRELERLGLAEASGVACWRLAADAEPQLRAMGERGDIIKRLHRGLAAAGVERGADSWSLASEAHERPVLGQLLGRGLDDELKGSAFAIIDGVDGRVHHLRLPDLDATGDGAIGAIVELRRLSGRADQPRLQLAVRSDLDIENQVAATGSTWIDRQLVARDPAALAHLGFGLEVRSAMERRIDHLGQSGLARRQGAQVAFRPGLLETLRQRELAIVGDRLCADLGLPYTPTRPGERVSGTFRRRLSLASGRFALIDNGLGFQLVPWSPGLDRELGRSVSGIAGSGTVDWSLGRKRGLSL